MTQLVDFVVISSTCRILTLDVSDLEDLATKYQEIKDKIQILKLRIQNDMVDNLDYQRFQKKYLNLETYQSGDTERELK